MKKRILATLSVCICSFLGPAGSEATFPEPSIAHWDVSVSDERKDPDYQKIQGLARDKKYREAMELVDKKERQFPKESTPKFLRAFLLNETGDYREALTGFRTASGDQERSLMGHASSGEQSRHPALYFGYCQVYRNLGDSELSERACKIAIGQHPDSPQPRYEYAQTLVATGMMENANSELEQAARLDPANPRYHFERGMNFFYLNRVSDAENAFLKALAADPNDMSSSYQLGYLHAAKKEKDKALPYVKRVLDGDKANPYWQSAKTLLDYINKDELDRLSLKTDPHEHHMGRSQTLYRSGKYGLSLLEIQTASRLKPKDAKTLEILVGMTSALLRLDQNEAAVARLIDLAKGNPVLEASGYQELGDIRVLQGNLDGARKNYEKALSLGDPNKLAKSSLAELPKDSSIPILRANPDELIAQPAEGLNQKGEIFAHYGMYERATAMFAMAMQMDPSHLMSKLNIATAYYHAGKYDRAISILERILLANGNHPHILAHRVLLAQAYAKNGDIDSCIKNLEIALKLSPAIKKTIAADPAFQSLKDKEPFKKLVQ